MSSSSKSIVSRLIKDIGIYGATDFFTKLVAFFTFPIISNALNPAAYGFVEIIATITWFLMIVSNIGINNSLSRFYWDENTTEGDRFNLLKTGLDIIIVSTSLSSIIGLLFLPFFYEIFPRDFQNLTWIAYFSSILLMFSQQILSVFFDVMRLRFNPLHFFITTFISRIVGALLGVYVVAYLKLGVDGLLTIQAIVTIATIPLGYFFVKKYFIGGSYDKYWRKEIISYGYPFIFTMVAFWIFGSIDRWMLLFFIDAAEVGIYSIAVKFSMILLMVSTALGMAWSPISIKIKTDNPTSYKKVYADILIVILSIITGIAGFLMLFLGEVIGILLNEVYYPSLIPGIILIFSIVFQTTQQFTGMGISIEKKTYLFARLTWISCFLNVFLNYFLIEKYGSTGAGVSTLISYIFLTSSYLIYSQKLHYIPYAKFNLNLIILGFILMFISLKLNAFELNLGLVLVKTCILILYFILVYFILRKLINSDLKEFI